MADAQVDRVIRPVQNNQGELSGALRKEMPIQEEPGLWEAIVQAVQRAHTSVPKTTQYKYGPQRPALWTSILN